MRLFKSLLVAPATLGLLAPLSATANEVTINDFAPAEQLAITNSRVDGLEARLNNFEAGSFSSTTSASFSVDMAIGAVDGNTTSEAVTTAYGYQMDLSTSFTGEDTLAVAIKAGQGAASLGELDLNSDGDGLIIDGITYSFPVGEKLTVLVGDTTDASKLYSTACVYGGFTNTLDDCGIPNTAIEKPDNSVALSAFYEIGNGFTGAFGYAGQGTANAGLGTNEGTDQYGAQLTYTGDSYGVSVNYANLDVSTAWGLNGYYTFASNLPSISLGYEFTERDAAVDQTQWFAGLQWDEIGPGTLGLAAGNKGPQADGGTEEMAYEAFYTYALNDGMSITPAIFVLENNGAGEEDETGFVVKTSFSF